MNNEYWDWSQRYIFYIWINLTPPLTQKERTELLNYRNKPEADPTLVDAMLSKKKSRKLKFKQTLPF